MSILTPRTTFYDKGTEAGVEIWQNGLHIKIFALAKCDDKIFIHAESLTGEFIEFETPFNAAIEELDKKAAGLAKTVFVTFRDLAISEFAYYKKCGNHVI